ncbi:MAG: glycosyltransferase [Massilia sp.]|nr:glycosyltransferase [Massilia sp.]MDB5953138.1 glycosyltransferase [Massilia sp.]
MPTADTAPDSAPNSAFNFTFKSAPGSVPGAALPAVSVVVPTCGRIDLLGRCLAALLGQDLDPRHYDIIVVDDQPDSRTRALVTHLNAGAAATGPALTYVANHGVHGPAAARNLGWRRARAPIVAFTDDDTVPSPGWLQNGLAAFDDSVDALCGRVEMPLPASPTDYERDAQQLETAEFVTANCFCRKSVLAALGGFDERFRLAWREDSDLHFRLLAMGARIAQAPQALVVHPVRPAPWGVSLLQVRKIAFDALLYKKHPGLYRQKIRASARWDYYAIVAALLLAVSGAAAGHPALAAAAAGAWCVPTLLLTARRLRGTTLRASHVAEMALTSALIPPLAVFWRIVGAIRFRVAFT